MDYGWLLTNTVSGLYLPAQALMVGDNVLHGTTLTNLRNAFGAKKPTQSPAVEKVVEYFRAMGDDAVAKDPSADAVVGLTVTVMRGELAIDERALENLLPSQRVGLFASAATYDAAVRINVTEHGAARLSIRLNVPDSMALLSECETCSSRPGYRQIDLLLAENFKQFMFRSVDELARLMSMQFEPRLSTALSHPLSLLNSIRDHRRATSALDNTQGVLGKAFYAGLPFKLGPGAAKLGLQPRQTQPLQAGHFPGGVAGARLTGREEETAAAYGAAMVDWINARAAGAGEPVAIWDLVVQPATEHPSHSVEVQLHTCPRASLSPCQLTPPTHTLRWTALGTRPRVPTCRSGPSRSCPGPPPSRTRRASSARGTSSKRTGPSARSTLRGGTCTKPTARRGCEQAAESRKTACARSWQ